MDGLRIFIPGRPVPQGSMRAVRVGRGESGRIVLISDNPALAQWRQTITEHAKGLSRFDGPVMVRLVFCIPKPKSRNDAYPSTRPDLDKLVRAVLDGLTDAGVWPDDGRVVDMTANKEWADEDRGPGVHVVITPAYVQQLAA